jgi:hypothetical protein
MKISSEPAARIGMEPAALLALGLENLAYIREVAFNGQVGFAIHAADGRVLGITPARALSMALARQHDLEPVSLH